MAIREIDIDELQVGMLVTKLDIAWIDSPFLFHHMRIKSLNDIQKLRAAKVRRVVIDPDKSVGAVEPTWLSRSAIPLPSSAAVAEILTAAPAQAPTDKQPMAPAATTELIKELSAARRIELQAKITLQKVMSAALTSRAIESRQLQPIIGDAVASVVRNDQALLTLMHLERHGGARQVTHAFGVLSLAMAVGHQTHLPTDALETLGFAAMLHDVGWVRLPATLFGKGRPYTDREKRMIKQHVGFSMQVINQSPTLPAAVGALVATHHERLDGSGYPDGLREPQLSAASAVLAVVDEYDSLIHGLMDQAPMHPAAALRSLFIQAQAGKLRRSVVEQLVQTLGVYPLTSIVELNTGEIGVVVELKRPHSLQPLVKVSYSADKVPLDPPIIVDLNTQLDTAQERRIERVLDPEQSDLDPYGLLKIDLPPVAA